MRTSARMPIARNDVNWAYRQHRRRRCVGWRNARGAPEIQAYDPVFFPGLAAEWSDRRPFVGPLTMELHSEPNEELESWIAAGTPPIYFGFGSTPVQTPVQTLAMISDVCAQLGERALIYSPAANSTRIRHADHVKRVGLVNYSTILPKCRAVVHTTVAPVPPPPACERECPR